MENDVNNIIEIFSKRPHLVILGAGASKAAIPNGDKNGRCICTMQDLVEKLSLDSLWSRVELSTTSSNIEDIYTELYEKEGCEDIIKEINSSIINFFMPFNLLEEPTIYDLLVLSLTKKDCIASFNWDPLLIQARIRNERITDNLPNIIFLHGNVSMGYCPTCGNFGSFGQICPEHNLFFRNSPLLYPIRQKDYVSNPAINKQWRGFDQMVANAALITIFGYSAPKTDVEAVKRMENAFLRYGRKQRTLDLITIIESPGLSKYDISDNWKHFINLTDVDFYFSTSFFETILADYPRRSVEMYINEKVKGSIWKDHHSYDMHTTYSFDSLKSLLSPLLEEELAISNQIIDNY